METILVKITPDDNGAAYKDAAQLLKENQVVGIPTETVYGLGGNAFSEEAVKRIFEAKGRPQDNPLIVHVSEFDEIYQLVGQVPDTARLLAEKFWPGPLTIILPKSDKVPLCVTGGLDTVAVRCPSHPVANRLIKEAGLPIAAPSANLSGKPSPTRASHVYDDMNGRIPMVIDGGDCAEGVESTVITLSTPVPKLLRPGNITISQLREALGQVEVDDAVLNPLKKGERVSSPGMKYKHYSPDADIVVLCGEYDKFCNYVNSHAEGNTYAMVFDGEGECLNVPYISYGANENYKELSHALFDSLRLLDDKGADVCFVRCPDRDNDDNLAVLNRLLRAASFQVIDL
ncbi:MAG: threonylcarbamoyl-AMP synthase [Clostridia bacterium]|nr:threonylcarbamoyl-AMP synthase [Clostridia bacterium]